MNTENNDNGIITQIISDENLPGSIQLSLDIKNICSKLYTSNKSVLILKNGISIPHRKEIKIKTMLSFLKILHFIILHPSAF